MTTSRSTPLALFSTSTESSRRTSQESTIPSQVVSVHDHVLPKGWQCKKDERTNKYYFTKEDKSGYDFGSSSSTSPSPSHVCCAHKHHPVFTTTRYRASEFSAERITKIFPEVDESHVTYLLRIYHNQEETVVKTLLGEGCRVHGTTAIDEELFYKLRNNFPHINPDTIRLLLAKNENREHETITAILGCQTTKGYRFNQFRPSSPTLKLRYLKLIFPEVDEDHLFDLLYNSGHNAREVIDTLEALGYKKIDRVAFLQEEDKHHEAKSVKETPVIRPTSLRLQFPKAFAKKEQYQKELHEEFPHVSMALIQMALDSTINHDKDQAAMFLRAMTPQDSDKYFPRAKSPQPIKLVFPSIGTQTDALVNTVPGEAVVILQTDIVQNESKDQSTWTKEDGVIEVVGKPKLAKGPDPTLRSGPQVQRTQLLGRKGPIYQNREGPTIDRVGPTVQRLVRIGSIGPEKSLRKGPDPSLRIVKPQERQLHLDF